MFFTIPYYTDQRVSNTERFRCTICGGRHGGNQAYFKGIRLKSSAIENETRKAGFPLPYCKYTTDSAQVKASATQK
jgi:hypothetical protein